MTADEARAVRHTGCKCVPREPTDAMVQAVVDQGVGGIAADWRLMYDAAPACECEAQRLLAEWVLTVSRMSKLKMPVAYAFILIQQRTRVYLARTKP